MADLYKVVYPSKSGEPLKTLFVSATSVANALAAVKTADTRHGIDSQHVTVFVAHPNIIIGS